MSNARTLNDDGSVIDQAGLSVVQGRTDKAYAADVRSRVAKALEPVIAIMAEANEKAGIEVNFTIGPDWRGCPTLQRISTVKKLD